MLLEINIPQEKLNFLNYFDQDPYSLESHSAVITQ